MLAIVVEKLTQSVTLERVTAAAIFGGSSNRSLVVEHTERENPQKSLGTVVVVGECGCGSQPVSKHTRALWRRVQATSERVCFPVAPPDDATTTVVCIELAMTSSSLFQFKYINPNKLKFLDFHPRPSI